MLAALSFSSVLAISMGSYVAVSFSTLERVDEQVVAASQLLEGENVLEETLYQVSSSDLADWSKNCLRTQSSDAISSGIWSPDFLRPAPC